MAFGRLQRAAATPPFSDINVVPLIDVMLVLLVIFIVTAPLLTSSLELELPRADGTGPGEALSFVSLAIDAEGRLHLGEQPLDDDALLPRLREAARADPATEVRLRADARVDYGRVAALIAVVQQAGLTRIGLVTETAAGPGR